MIKVRPLVVAVARPRVIGTLAAFVVALVLPFLVDENWLQNFAVMLIFAFGALGLDVLTGRTGQVSLGHAFFLTAGAYTAGALGANLHLTAAIWIPAAGVLAGLLGLIVAPTALRLRGLYLAIVTIGLVYLGQHLGNNLTAVTDGPGGRSLPAVSFGPLQFSKGVSIGNTFFDTNGLYYYLALLLLILGMVYVHNLSRSRVGRDMAAVRDRELAAAVLGVNVARTKTTAFVISSAMAGVAGAMYGSLLTFVRPNTFDLVLSIEFVAIIIVGGMSSIWGPLLGAIFVLGLPDLLNEYSGSIPFLAGGTSTTGIPPLDAATIVYGVLLIVFLLLEPRGIVGLAHRIGSLVRRRREVTAADGVITLGTAATALAAATLTEGKEECN